MPAVAAGADTCGPAPGSSCGLRPTRDRDGGGSPQGPLHPGGPENRRGTRRGPGSGVPGLVMPAGSPRTTSWPSWMAPAKRRRPPRASPNPAPAPAPPLRTPGPSSDSLPRRRTLGFLEDLLQPGAAPGVPGSFTGSGGGHGQDPPAHGGAHGSRQADLPPRPLLHRDRLHPGGPDSAEANKARWAEQGAKVSFTAFVVWACSRVLREFPMVNGTISGNNLIFRGNVNVGVAVDLDPGLIVPVIHDADELSLVGIGKRIVDLAERARSRRLNPEEIQGATFSITNPGVLGTLAGTPVIPEGDQWDPGNRRHREEGRGGGGSRDRERIHCHPEAVHFHPWATTTGWWTGRMPPGSWRASRSSWRLSRRMPEEKLPPLEVRRLGRVSVRGGPRPPVRSW